MKLCFILSDYQSHRRAGLDYLRSLEALDVGVVETPEEADIIIIHDEPWSYPGYYRALPVLRQRYVIAYAVWEPDRLSADVARWLGLADEIWTCSSYCRDVMAPAVKKITVVPHIVPPSPPTDAEAEQQLRSKFGLSGDGFLFYTISRQEERKNLEAGIRAFAKAFPDGSAKYLVKTPFPLSTELAGIPGVISIAEQLDDSTIAALHQMAHCYVSPHCSEGWGLCLTDAMAHGNLVVATGYSGNMDYTDETNALLVRFRMGTIRQPETRMRFGFDVTDASAQWAHVDEEDLGTQLIRVRREWDSLAPLRQAARSGMAAYDAGRIGRLMLQRLAEIRGTCLSKSVVRPVPFARPMG